MLKELCYSCKKRPESKKCKNIVHDWCKDHWVRPSLSQWDLVCRKFESTTTTAMKNVYPCKILWPISGYEFCKYALFTLFLNNDKHVNEFIRMYLLTGQKFWFRWGCVFHKFFFPKIHPTLFVIAIWLAHSTM